MAPHCLRPHRSVSERVAFWLKPCMDNGLGNYHTDSVGQQPKEQAEWGEALINPGVSWHALTLPTGCSWIEEHLEQPRALPSLPHPSLKQWPGLVWCSWLPRQMVHWVGTGRAWDVHGQWCRWWKHTDMLWLELVALLKFYLVGRVMPASRLCIWDDISKPNSVMGDVRIGSPRFFCVNLGCDPANGPI